MKISEFLSQADVVVDMPASRKPELLRELARMVTSALGLLPDEVASEILKREELGSTGMGGGIAIPHARIRGVTRPFGVLAKLRQPIEFDAVDAQPVDLVFLVLLPVTSDGDRLGALACIARALREQKIVSQLRRASDATALYRAIVAS